MAVYRFSALTDGQAISFNPDADVLSFDQSSIAAADVRASAEGAGLRFSVGAKDVLLSNVTPSQVSISNVVFADGSRLLFGSNAANSLAGTAGRDHLEGFAGADTLDGGAGADVMYGGLHDDVYIVDSPGDIVVELEGGGSNDEVRSSVSHSLSPWVNNLTLTGNAEVNGTGNELPNIIRHQGAGDAYLDGGAGNDTLIGGSGFDFFTFSPPSGYGSDSVDGAGGRDWMSFEANGAVTVDFRTGTVSGGAAGSVRFANIEGVVGSLASDRMTAGSAAVDLRGYGGNDTLVGGAGADTLDGDAAFDHPSSASGNDWLEGGGGADVLAGGGGSDRFVYRAAAEGRDEIFGFTPGEDEFVFDGSGFSQIGASGAFSASDARFRSGAAAQDADDRVVYNPTSGQLWYDADGNGAGSAQLIATLQSSAPVSASDIAVVNGSTGTAPPPPPPPPTGSSTGTSGNDTLTGTSGADTLNGGLGNDAYYVTPGDVILDSGGIDEIFAAASFALPSAVENITYTGTANTSSVGTSIGNRMTGNGGANYLDGRGGNDTLAGGAGTDTLVGGAGNDTFVFAQLGADRISDFASGGDRIAFEDSVFSGVASAGSFRSGAGISSGQDADDRVIYNSSTGQLYYDADGAGGAAGQLVATLANAPGLAASDIAVI
jgi:Ca2+-binding RTX toxin-like protein